MTGNVRAELPGSHQRGRDPLTQLQSHFRVHHTAPLLLLYLVDLAPCEAVCNWGIGVLH